MFHGTSRPSKLMALFQKIHSKLLFQRKEEKKIHVRRASKEILRTTKKDIMLGPLIGQTFQVQLVYQSIGEINLRRSNFKS